jgi:hypothetical protein
MEPAFERDPDGLFSMTVKALNEILMTDPYMNGWQWHLEWINLPGAIQIQIAGTACAAEEWQCPAFFAATSIAEYEEVDEAAKRLQERIHEKLEAWHRE